MNKTEARSALIQIAAKLIHSNYVPSEIEEDHERPRYSRKEVAAISGRIRESHREIALEIRAVVDALRD